MHAEEYDILDFSSRVLGSGRSPPASLNPFGLSLQPNLVNENIRRQLRRGVPSLSAKCGWWRLCCKAGKAREMPWQEAYMAGVAGYYVA